ncbi:hypothetical protein ABZ835_07080 [Streptomyces sp. NPDC047461]|uniref:hypothetical protein n=1 Tax=Streptomyces sp. NPDC047461 TaxID=3155619 RepID=UPI0033E22BBB
MGEGRSGGGVPGRRHVHPGGTGSPGADGLETLLAAAMREDAGPRENRAGAEGERQAVAAFRAARDAGAHRARTRRRDDWRPREQRRLSRSLRATLSVFLASLTLGGVAFATIGTGGGSSPEAGKKDPPRPRTSAPVRQPATTAPATESPSAQPDRPVTAQDTEAHCRAYEKVGGRGNALNSTAWQRLVDAAGGEGNIARYCADRLAQDTTADEPGKSEKNAGDPPGKKKQ